MKTILAIDPGTTESGILIYSNGRVSECRMLENPELLVSLRGGIFKAEECAIEMIASYGMAVGKEVFETCVWIGRFQEAAQRSGYIVSLHFRKDIKIHLCGTVKAKDANIRQALIDKHGAPGTKKAPGPTYGVSGHIWAALAVAEYAASLDISNAARQQK